MAKSYFPTLFGPRADEARLFRSLKREGDRVPPDLEAATRFRIQTCSILPMPE